MQTAVVPCTGVRICLQCQHRFDGDSWRCPACGWEPDGNGFLRFAPEFGRDEGMPEESFEQLEELEERRAR